MENLGALGRAGREPASAHFPERQVALDDRVSEGARSIELVDEPDGSERGLEGEVAAHRGAARVVRHDRAADEVVGVEVERRHGDVHLEARLVVLLDVEVLLLRLALGRHADRPPAERGLVGERVVEAHRAEVRLSKGGNVGRESAPFPLAE